MLGAREECTHISVSYNPDECEPRHTCVVLLMAAAVQSHPSAQHVVRLAVLGQRWYAVVYLATLDNSRAWWRFEAVDFQCLTSSRYSNARLVRAAANALGSVFDVLFCRFNWQSLAFSIHLQTLHRKTAICTCQQWFPIYLLHSPIVAEDTTMRKYQGILKNMVRVSLPSSAHTLGISPMAEQEVRMPHSILIGDACYDRGASRFPEVPQFGGA